MKWSTSKIWSTKWSTIWRPVMYYSVHLCVTAKEQETYTAMHKYCNNFYMNKQNHDMQTYKQVQCAV
jgi:hypothetical protein